MIILLSSCSSQENTSIKPDEKTKPQAVIITKNQTSPPSWPGEDDLELSGSGACGKGHKEWAKTSLGGTYIKAVGRLG